MKQEVQKTNEESEQALAKRVEELNASHTEVLSQKDKAIQEEAKKAEEKI